MSEIDGIVATQKEHGRRLNEHQDVHKEIWSAVNMVRNRPPLWAGAIITILSAIATGAIVAMVT